MKQSTISWRVYYLQQKINGLGDKYWRIENMKASTAVKRKLESVYAALSRELFKKLRKFQRICEHPDQRMESGGQCMGLVCCDCDKVLQSW